MASILPCVRFPVLDFRSRNLITTIRRAVYPRLPTDSVDHDMFCMLHKGDRILTNDKLNIIGVIDWSKVASQNHSRSPHSRI
jgi:hypothetical protein